VENDMETDSAAGSGGNAPKVAGEGYEKAYFQNLEQGGAELGANEKNLDVILDVPVTMAMEIGRASLSIRDLLKLNQGSVVELDRLAGEPLDVTINGTLVAHGEVVIVNDHFGLRLTDVVSPAERIRRLR
jgi:flagellar motor switch protein FliN/FliY